MGIRFQCPNGHKLNVKADLAGKRASCPECGVKLMIPAASAEPVTAPAATVAPAAIVNGPTPPAAGVWYMRTSGGEQLGPVPAAQFSEWITAGRVTGDSLIWRDGWPEWKLARNAADTLPTPLAAVPVAATESVAIPIVPETIIPDAIVPVQTAQSIIALGIESETESTDGAPPDKLTTDVPPAALQYEVQRRRSRKTQLTVAVAMLVTVIVLAAVLVWVIMVNAAAPPPVAQ
jgi:hypothetical protein